MRNNNQHTALITGGTRGIGLAIACKLAAAGCRVVITFRSDSDRAASAVGELSDKGFDVLALPLDVTSRTDVKALLSELKERAFLPDILVNNAGILSTNYLRFMTPEQWHGPIDVSLNGAFYLTQAVLKGMMRKRWGRVVNIASDAGLLGDAMRASYAAAKAGLLGLTRTSAREVAAMGITVNAVSPGPIQTRMTDEMPDARRNAQLSQIPMARFGTPEEVAAVVAFLASDESEYMTGQCISVDGGLYTRS